jgi:hypothetical protein
MLLLAGHVDEFWPKRELGPILRVFGISWADTGCVIPKVGRIRHRAEGFDPGTGAAAELLVTWSGPMVTLGPADPTFSLGAADGFCDLS